MMNNNSRIKTEKISTKTFGTELSYDETISKLIIERLERPRLEMVKSKENNEIDAFVAIKAFKAKYNLSTTFEEIKEAMLQAVKESEEEELAVAVAFQSLLLSDHHFNEKHLQKLGKLSTYGLKGDETIYITVVNQLQGHRASKKQQQKNKKKGGNCVIS